jgi:hypothetical protein
MLQGARSLSGILSRYLSLYTLIYGIVVFLWLSPDEQTWFVAILGWIGAVLITARIVIRFGLRLDPILIGAVIGAGATVCTVLLMFLKTSLHAHVIPDYPLATMIGVAERLPAWALAGALFGAGVRVLR